MDTVPAVTLIEMFRVKRKALSDKTFNKFCFVFSCRICGEGIIVSNNNELRVKCGDLLYIPRGANYSQRTCGEEVIAFHINSYTPMPNSIKVFTCKEKEKLCKLFLYAYKVWEEKSDNYMYKCTAVLYEILSMFNIFKENVRIGNPIMQTAFDYLNNYMFHTDFSIEELCKNCSVSRTFFNIQFKKTYNTTPVKYITEKRIEKAKFLLLSGNYTNEEIAEFCGFCNVKRFYNVFKQYTNLTTKEFKKAEK